jgi:phosphomannomutase
MSNITKPMISISGVRGIVDNKESKDSFYSLLADFTCAFAQYTKLKTKKDNCKIVIGRDTRKTGPEILDITASNLKNLNCSIIDLGIVTTPTVEIMVKHLNADGGIIITASHNPSNWNALKFVGSTGMFLTQKEFEELFEIFKSKKVISSLSKVDADLDLKYQKTANKTHIDLVCSNINIEKIKSKKFKVIIDSCNGAGSEITPILLEQLGCEVIKLNCDTNKEFPRNPEPNLKNLEHTIDFVKKQDADICFVQDPDADRLAVISDKGVFIGEEYSLVLSAMYMLADKKGDVVVNVSTSMMIDEIAKRYGVKVYRTKVGEINVSEKMLEIGAVIGGEGNGGVICPLFHYGRDSLVGIALILSLMAETEKSISDLVEEVPVFFMKKEKIDIGKETFLARIDNMKECFQDYILDETDGLKFIWSDKWIQIRPSNTEPIVRIMAEAKTQEQTDELANIVRKILL